MGTGTNFATTSIHWTNRVVAPDTPAHLIAINSHPPRKYRDVRVPPRGYLSREPSAPRSLSASEPSDADSAAASARFA